MTNFEILALGVLADRTGPGQTIELESDRQVAFWQAMESKGYAQLHTSVRCGFERIRGNFVSLTDKGRAIADDDALPRETET